MRKKVLFMMLLLFCLAFSQNRQNVLCQREDRICQLMELDSVPKFVGGYDSLLAYFDKHFIMPEIYADANIQGQVICKFVVTENGNIMDVKVLQGIDKELDEEVVRVISSMPQWCSGKKKGQAVKSMYFLPIYIRIKLAD